MSDRAVRQCHGKKKHRSERIAHSWAKNTQKHTGVAMKPYPCHFCNSWHVGSARIHDPSIHSRPRHERYEQPLVRVPPPSSKHTKRIEQLLAKPLFVEVEKAMSVVAEPAPTIDDLIKADPCFIDFTGKKIGKLTVDHYESRGRWIVRCDCGGIDRRATKTIRAYIAEGRTDSCSTCKRGKKSEVIHGNE